MQDNKATIIKINQRLRELYEKGMELRNEIVTTKNNFVIAKNKLSAAESDIDKTKKRLIDNKDLGTIEYRKRKLFFSASALALVAGIVFSFTLNPFLGIGVCAVSTVSLISNSIMASKLKKLINIEKCAIDKLDEKELDAKQSIDNLEVCYNNYITALEEELCNLNKKFDTLKKYREELIGKIVAKQDPNFVDDKKVCLDFSLAMTY